MTELNNQGLKNPEEWKAKGYCIPQYDRGKIQRMTRENPLWIHFGAGNIFRAFQANAVEKLLNMGETDRGIIAVEGFDYEIIEKMYRPHDNLSILVTLKADGTIEKTVVGSIMETLVLDSGNAKEYGRLKEIFENPSLQIASFTITEKGYSLTDAKGKILPQAEEDFQAGPQKASSYMGKVAALLYARYQAGEYPVAMVSMDNCSHNGDRLYKVIRTFAEKWAEKGLVDEGFVRYVDAKEKVSFPWTMIDKITPRPDAAVEELLRKDGTGGLNSVVTSRNTYVAPFVNAEECEYLVIEDAFPNGREKLEKAGFMFTNRETVEKVERMKVCTCLNPLHTALAVFGCLLGYEKISDEMKDDDLKKLVQIIGYKEGLPVVTDPGILNPREFLDTVLNVRIPNPFMPDTPQRIATDTSQKLAIRFGETIKEYASSQEKDVSDLKMIPFVFAGWIRYLMAVDDKGRQFTLSPDPILDMVCPYVSKITFGKEYTEESIEERIRPILENKAIFGVDLYDVGMARQVCRYVLEMVKGPGAVREALKKYTRKDEENKKHEIIEKICHTGIIPVVVLQNAEDAFPLAKALCGGGLPCAEVTFRTEAAEEAIRIISEKFPDMLVGAGTVLTVEQAERAKRAGAAFIVSPGFNPEVVDYCIDKDMFIIPGCMTPSEAEQAIQRGIDIIKFFPAEPAGGLKMIRALSAPYTGLKFMPTGGISPSNVSDYLNCEKIVACGGSWMVKEEFIKEGNFEKIKELAKEAAEIVRKSRGRES